MPIYEYHCNQCDSTFEKMARWSEADRRPVCPNCQSQDTQKQISAVASFGSSGSVSTTSFGGGCGASGSFR